MELQADSHTEALQVYEDPMIVISRRMDEAMREAGFSRKGSRWRRESDPLPIVVYQEQAKTGGPRYGFSILFGWPHRNPAEWACFQLSQGEACGRGSHYYDMSSEQSRRVVEMDFLQFTVPAASRFHTGQELADALADAELPPSQSGRGEVGRVKDLIDVAEAHGLPDVKGRALKLAKRLDSSWESRSSIRELAQFVPEVASVIDWEAPAPRRRWWQR